MKKQATSLVPLLAALTIAIFPSRASADWYWQNPLPVGDGLGHVAFVSATEGWTTSSGGRLLHTIDAGASWSSLNPEPGQSLRFLDGPGPGISFLDPSNGWVIGTRGTMEEPAGAAIFGTANGGSSWTQTNIPASNYGIGIQFVDPDTGWALVGAGTFPTSITGAVIRSTDGGATWNVAHTTAAQEVVVYISFVSASEGWAVQDSVDASSGDFTPPYKILHTTDGGSNWSTQLTASTGGEFEVIQFTDALNGWMCGSDARLMKTTNGGVLWSDHGLGQDWVHRRQAMVFQHPVVLRRSARANVTYGLALAGVSWRERRRQAEEALAEVGLLELAGRPARALSGGERQRLALARAWALHPEVLLLDEPTASLDPAATRAVETVIAAFDMAGTKIIMTTHDLGQARRLADEVLFLHKGRLLEHSPAPDFFERPSTPEGRAYVAGELIW